MIPKVDVPNGKLKLTRILGIAAVITVGIVGISFAQSSNAKSIGAQLQSNNLLNLISDLGGTTDQMLANASQLHDQVAQVQGKLGQLNQQEAILEKQTQTGQALQQQLQTQEQLTSNGISLMQQILSKEQTSVQTTTMLSSQTQQLANGVAQNAQQMGQLVPMLGTSLDQSVTLNNQLDLLLNELAKSQDSFKLFGTLNKVITNPLNVTDSIKAITDSALPPSVKDILKSLLP